MDDTPPVWRVGDEREVLLHFLHYVRESMVRKVVGVTEEQARWSPVGSGTSLLWLVQHVDFAEQIWLRHRFAGEPMEVPANAAIPSATLDEAIEHYRATWARVDDIIEDAHLDDALPEPSHRSGTTVDLRWILAHLIEEISRHAGHADIIREMIDDQTGR